MGIMDQLSEGVATVAREAQKALDGGDNSDEVRRHYQRAQAQIRAVHLVA